MMMMRWTLVLFGAVLASCMDRDRAQPDGGSNCGADLTGCDYLGLSFRWASAKAARSPIR